MHSTKGPSPEPPISLQQQGVSSYPAGAAVPMPQPQTHAVSAPVPPQAAAPAYGAPAQAHVASAPVPPAPMPFAPSAGQYAPAAAAPAPASFAPAPAMTPPAPSAGAEEVLGRNVTAILASVLVFAGLLLLGVTMIPLFDDVMKVAFMFTLSGTLAVAGSLLAIFKRNPFSSALMGCGMGSLFISIFATHVYFGMLSELPAYALLLLWMAVCMVLIWKTDSLLLAITLQVGLALSVCAACGSNFSGEKVALLVGYQAIASVIVVGGNMLFYRKMFRTSLFIAVCLSLMVSSALWLEYGSGIDGWSIDGVQGWVAVAFIVQFLTTLALCALLVASIWKQAKGLDARARRSELTTWRLQIVAGALLLAYAVRIDIYDALRDGSHVAAFGSAGYVDAAFLRVDAMAMCATVLTLFLIVVALVVFGRCASGAHVASDAQASLAGESAGLPLSECAWRIVNPALYVLFVILALFVASFANDLLWATGVPPLGFLWVAALCAMGLRWAAGLRGFDVVALSLLAMDALYMACIGFPRFLPAFPLSTSIALGVVYTVGLCLAAGLLVRSMGAGSAGIVSYAVACTFLVMSCLCFCTPWIGWGYQASVCCMVCALVCVIVGFALRVGGLRLYGLILVLACTLKLVTIDMFDFDPIARVGALIAGGVICFVISALYSFAVKRLQEERK
ncbi:hypothetical protein [Denitrobacterium detoxificans]|uniref:hypothetical protein n=1 Tax=Denitrobacterium detoxificans TaxID=79604 RepID=UPI0026EFFC96|nr:hypothetical protein [Denitrobacterium detoxificans]MBE6466645.1 DUF2339 domain-containing protein [Denitrobacterium detoxificans]